MIERLLYSRIQEEINELEDLLEILGNPDTITDSDDVALDLTLIKNRLDMFKTFKGMVKKAALDRDFIDGESIMNVKEKTMFYRLTRFISFLRKPFIKK